MKQKYIYPPPPKYKAKKLKHLVKKWYLISKTKKKNSCWVQTQKITTKPPSSTHIQQGSTLPDKSKFFNVLTFIVNCNDNQ